MLLEDVIEEYRFDLLANNFSARTIKGYINNSKKLVRYLKNDCNLTTINEVKSHHVQSYLIHHKKNGAKATYVNSMLKVIRTLFVFCVEEDYISKDNNPTLKVKWMKMEKTLIKIFNDEEIAKMINVYNKKDYLSVRNQLILLMFIDVGIRNLELCELKNKQIMDDTILIKGKGAKERYVYISPFLQKFIVRYERAKERYFKERVMHDDNYFLSFTGRQLTREANMRIVKHAAEKANVRKEIRSSPHTLRHYFSQKMLETSDVYSLSRLLGHNDITTTKIYLQSMEDESILNSTRQVSPLMTLKKGRK